MFIKHFYVQKSASIRRRTSLSTLGVLHIPASKFEPTEVFSSVGVQPRAITVKDRLQHRQESLANAALRKDAKGKAAAKSAGGPKKKK